MNVNWLRLLLLLLATFIAVFIQATLDLPRRWLGAPLNCLPALMVYTGLQAELPVVCLVAFLGGLWSDSLSANPLGVSVLPLFITGAFLHRWRDLLLRELGYAQLILGVAASAAIPLGTLLLLVTAGQPPRVDWYSALQLCVLAVIGGALTPLCFRLMEYLTSLFAYRDVPTISFRPDREIKRGRY